MNKLYMSRVKAFNLYLASSYGLTAGRVAFSDISDMQQLGQSFLENSAFLIHGQSLGHASGSLDPELDVVR